MPPAGADAVVSPSAEKMIVEFGHAHDLGNKLLEEKNNVEEEQSMW